MSKRALASSGYWRRRGAVLASSGRRPPASPASSYTFVKERHRRRAATLPRGKLLHDADITSSRAAVPDDVQPRPVAVGLAPRPITPTS
ncbi:hypothetical protein Dimus_020560, partial [Dionaea muscipula]